MPRRTKSTPSRVEQSRLRAEAAAHGTRSLAQAAAVSAAAPRRVPSWPAPAATVASAVVFLVGWYAYGPTARVGGARWLPLVAALTVAAAFAATAVKRWPDARSVPRRVCATVSVALCALFVVGSTTSVVVDGKVHLAGSDTAQAVAMIRQVQDDLVEIASYDRLLRLDTPVARVEIDSYAPAATRLAEIAGHYAGLRVEDLPSAQFIPVLRQVATAADFGARALDGKRDLTLQHDARLEANVTSWRETYTEAVLSAGPQLADLARVYGFALVDPDRDPVE